MAVDLSELIEMRDRLIVTRAKGVKVAAVGQEHLEFRSDEQMAAAIADLEVRIRRASGTSLTSNVVRFSSSKGV